MANARLVYARESAPCGGIIACCLRACGWRARARMSRMACDSFCTLPAILSVLASYGQVEGRIPDPTPGGSFEGFFGVELANAV